MCLLCMSEGSGPSHLISFLISIIILHTRINRNGHLLLLFRQLFFGFDGPKPLFFLPEISEKFYSTWVKQKKSSFSLNGNIFVSLEGFFFLTVLHYYKAETNFKRKLCFPVKKQTASVILNTSRYACSAITKTTC